MDRNQIENAIEFLLSVLDAMDGDHDLEDGGDDEHWLAGSEDDRECDPGDWGIADRDGLWEQGG